MSIQRDTDESEGVKDCLSLTLGVEEKSSHEDKLFIFESWQFAVTCYRNHHA